MAKRNTSGPALQVRPASPTPSARRRPTLAGAAVIALLVSLIYFPALRGGFILDDNTALTENPLVTAGGLSAIWRITDSHDAWPVTTSSFWLEWRLWGMQSTGYHVTNLGLDLLATLLMWSILETLAVDGAFLAALLFAVHPVNVESVAWIGQRKGLLAMVFFLVSILCYLNAEALSPPSRQPAAPSQRWQYALSLTAFVLAMLSKGSVATLPLVLLLVVWWQRPLTARDLLRTAPFMLVTVVLAGMNIWIQTDGLQLQFRNAGFAQRLLGASAVVWFYLYKAILPTNLSFVYPLWHIEVGSVLWWLPLCAAVAVTAVLWRYRSSSTRPLLFAWLYFCIALVPVMGFTDVVFMQYSLVADHYQYLALIAVVAIAAAAWEAWRQRMRESVRWIPNAAAVAAVGGLSLLTWQHSGLYTNGMTLYQATLATNPDAWFAHNNLGLELLRNGHPQEAAAQFEAAVQVHPDFAEAHFNLAGIYADAGQLQKAIVHYKEAARLKPAYPEYQHNLGTAFLQAGQFDEAIARYRQALQLRPDFPEAHYNLGIALAQTDRLEQAIAEYQRALQLKPDYPEAHYKLGTALAQMHQLDPAIQHFQEALKLRPDYAEARNNFGGVLFEAGRSQEAIEQYEQALRLKPDFAEAHSNLGRASLQAHLTKEAIAHFRQAVQLTPDSPEAHNDLGVALTEAGELADAIGQFEQALRLKPDYPDARNNLQEALAMKEKPHGDQD